MSQKEKIIFKLKKILLKNKIKLSKEDNFTNLNLLNNPMVDSLKLLNLITDIETTFKFKFSTSFLQSKKIGSIENIIKKIIKRK
tara:strand:+ start:1091 stop:1342 length:252 start_codon:yes stop_codon:yes gene_type:complete